MTLTKDSLAQRRERIPFCDPWKPLDSFFPPFSLPSYFLPFFLPSFTEVSSHVESLSCPNYFFIFLVCVCVFSVSPFRSFPSLICSVICSYLRTGRKSLLEALTSEMGRPWKFHVGYGFPNFLVHGSPEVCYLFTAHQAQINPSLFCLLNSQVQRMEQQQFAW